MQISINKIIEGIEFEFIIFEGYITITRTNKADWVRHEIHKMVVETERIPFLTMSIIDIDSIMEIETIMARESHK